MLSDLTISNPSTGRIRADFIGIHLFLNSLERRSNEGGTSEDEIKRGRIALSKVGSEFGEDEEV